VADVRILVGLLMGLVIKWLLSGYGVAIKGLFSNT